MLLSAASLLMRTVGVSFQVHVSNRVGAETMGLFSLLSGVYGFALTLATSGIHLGVTRLVVEAIGRHETGRIRNVMRRASLYCILFGLGAAFLLFFLAPVIGECWLKDTRTISSLRLLAITLPLISLSSAWSGYFTAVRRTYKNAAVQVSEQAIKIAATMYLLAFLIPTGTEGTCCALVLGGALAEFLSFLMEATLYVADRRRHFADHKVKTPPQGEGRELVGITLPIAFTAYIRSGLITLQHILIPQGLRNSGSSHAAALVAYGSIQSMALPVVLYPAALISSFSGLLVPEMAESSVQNAQKRISYMICRVFSLALLFSIGVAGILVCFSHELGTLLYPNTDAGRYIRILAPLIPIMYLDTATDAMLKGMGEQVYSMKINIADAALSVLMVYFLVPRYGIGGYLFAIYLSELFNTVMSVTRLLCISQVKVRLFKWVYKPLFCVVTATALARWIFASLPGASAPSAWCAALHCAVTLGLYILLLLLIRGIDREDLSWFGALFKRGDGEKKSQKELAELLPLKGRCERRAQK